MIEKHEVKQISWCDSSSQPADCLTKAGASCEKLLCVLQGNAKLFCRKLNVVLLKKKKPGKKKKKLRISGVSVGVCYLNLEWIRLN